MNPHGLQDEDHYTTVYDIYLMFQEALKYDEFQDIITHHNYYITIPNIDGTSRDITWETTNYYFLEWHRGPKDVYRLMEVKQEPPMKPDPACACTARTNMGNPFITIIMGHPTKKRSIQK